MPKKIAAAVPPALVAELVTRFKAGERLPALGRYASEQLQRSIAPVSTRGWIIKALGGLDAYQAALAVREQEHPRAKPVPPQRAPRDPSVPRPVVDDSEAKTITKTPVADGWKTESVMVKGLREEVFVAPDGQRYVHATGSERADLLVDLTEKHPGMKVVRLRLQEGSRLAKKLKREKKLVVHDEKVRTEKAAVKAVRRKH